MTEGATKMKIQLKNIGPHNNLTFESSKDIGYSIFASNGQGKTFISRCFSALQDENYEHINHLTSFGSNFSSFEVEINGNSSKFEIEDGIIRRDVKLDRIFYVFNSDYINDNVEKRGYKPDNTISGIILGKNQIDLTKEKNELETIKNKFREKETSIINEIDKAKKALDRVKVSKVMNEYKELTFSNIINLPLPEHHDYESRYDKVKKISIMPEDLQDIRKLSLIEDQINYDSLEKLLNEKVTPSNFEKEFIDYVKQNVDFVEKGLDILESDSKVCPYCKRLLDEESLDIIHQYSKFLEDKESLTIKQLSSQREIVKICLNKINDIKKEIDALKKDEEIIKNYIPDLDKISYPQLEDLIIEISSLYSQLISFIEDKLAHLSSLSIEIKQYNYRNLVSRFNNMVNSINKEIENTNKKKNNTQVLLKNNKKVLCTELLKKLRIDNDFMIKDYFDIMAEIKSKKEEISKKELTNNLDKKELIASTFSGLIDNYFHNKYVFDKENFEIKLKKTHKIDDGRFTLSDGEKSVIAFIYYISTVFEIVETEDDYEKIIFIIDDPISSMDFSYVYETASVIRNLKDILKIQYDKKIILTHNIEFFNLLKRNRVSKASYILKNNTIEKMTKEMMMPYECHLEDVYYVAKRKNKPTHTIPNSIRHIIETICSFEYNDKESRVLETFIKDKEEFKHNNYIYTLMQDLSHGAYRANESYLEDELINACEKVIEFIENHYPGQLTDIKKYVS